MLEGFVDNLLNDHLDEVCAKRPNLPRPVCNELVTVAAKSVAGLSPDTGALEQTAKTEFKKPEFLNSLLARSYGDSIPLGLDFKSIDSENGESVLGVSYSIEYELLEHDSADSDSWRKMTDLSFIANGTVVNDSDANPRDFLDTKISLAKSYTTRIPVQDLDFGTKLTNAAVDAASACPDAAAAATEACKKAKQKAFDLLDGTAAFLSAFQRIEFGVDIGIESDQKVDAKQDKFGLFLAGQYESWGNDSKIGSLGIVLSYRLALDGINPNTDTARSEAGDDSSFGRFSSELGFTMPVGTHFDKRLSLGVNYRWYKEIDAESVIKDAGLDSYNLRTVSLVTPSGLYASYSSGELPFDQSSDDTLELGWKTYF
jgi:hypothetical protein